MGHGHTGLTFNALRGANLARLPQFKNKQGELAHSEPDGSDWLPSQWLQAVIGELGEYANIRKKFERGDLSREEYEILAAKELADVQTYLDLLALRALDLGDFAHPNGIDLGRATMAKFNEVSNRVGSNVYLAADDWHYDHQTLAEGIESEANSRKEIKHSNIAREITTGRKFFVTSRELEKVQANPENYEFVCENAHEDEDFSYFCPSQYCRCRQ